MQSHPHHSKPHQPTPSTPSKSIFRPHKTHLSFTFKDSSHIYDEIREYLMTESLFKSLKVNRKLRISSVITSLTLDAAEINWKLRRSGLKKVSLFNFLKEFRNLQSVKITGVSFKDFSGLRKAFKSFRGLKSLEIAFQGTADGRNSLQDFIKEISPRLHQLKLDFPGYFYPERRKVLDENRSNLRNFRIDRLNNLKILALHLPISSFLHDKGNLRYIDLSPMKRLNQLQSLDITLADHSTKWDKEIDTKELHFNPNKLFQNLKKFTWNVHSYSSLVPKKLELIGPQIASQLKYLDDFGLGYRHSTAKVYFIELAQCLATLQTKLNSLHFAYNDSELFERDAKVLFSALSLERLKSLHTLSLEFKYCKGMTNEFLAGLAKACAENLTELKSLRLLFNPTEQEKNKIRSFVKAVFEIEGVSNKGIKNFASILSKGCQNLEFVSLEFKKYLQISDSGVKSLCQKLEGLKKLKTVWIKFEDCENVTEKGCEKAAKLLGPQRDVVVCESKTSRYCPCGSKH